MLTHHLVKIGLIFVAGVLLVQCKDHCKNYCYYFHNDYCQIIIEKQSGGKMRGNWVAVWDCNRDTDKKKKGYLVFSKRFWEKLSIGDTLIKHHRDSVYYLIKLGQPVEGEILYSNTNLKCDCSKYKEDKPK